MIEIRDIIRSQLFRSRKVKIIIFISSVDCEWSDWETWTDCSRSCGVGNRTIHRRISQVALNDGLDCAGNDTLTESCNSNPCPGIKFRFRYINEHFIKIVMYDEF